MSARCCRATNRATASTTSPSATCRRRCSSAISAPLARSAVSPSAVPAASPAATRSTLPPDLTQEEHFEELPLGTRGGTVGPLHLPVDAEYDIQIRLARDRNEHVEGLREPHEVEFMLDGERIGLFTVKPPPQGKDHSPGRPAPERSRSREGRARTSSPSPSRRRRRRCSRPSASRSRRTSTWTGIRASSRPSTRSPSTVRTTRKGPAIRRAAGALFVCKPQRAADEDACAKRILVDPDAARVSPSRHRRRPRSAR